MSLRLTKSVTNSVELKRNSPKPHSSYVEGENMIEKVVDKIQKKKFFFTSSAKKSFSLMG